MDNMNMVVMTSFAIEVIKTEIYIVTLTMRFDERTHQPSCFLHGCASVLLAEKAASIGGFMNINQETNLVFGIEINANHIKSKREGIVTAVATPIHIGKTTMVWNIRITDEENDLISISRCTLGVVPKKK